jgi:hypothetical protein
MMAIDGTWSRECLLIDVSETGASIKLMDAPGDLREFFLVLSGFSKPVFRRCARVWVDGLQMGVSFDKGPVRGKTLRNVRREAQLV